MRVLIFSEKILSRGMPCALSASPSCDCSSWVRCEHRAYPMRMSALGVSGSLGRGRRGAGPPRLPGAPVGRGRHPQQLGESGHLLEAASVVDPGDGTRARSARRTGLDPTARAGVALDVVRVASGGVLMARHARNSLTNDSRTGPRHQLGENGFWELIGPPGRSLHPALISLPERSVCEGNSGLLVHFGRIVQNVAKESTDHRVRMWAPVGQAVALLLGPYAEVVLHDPDTDRILAIWNSMSSRGPGDPSLLGELDTLDPSARDVFGPYEKLLADGRRLSSVSAVLRERTGRPLRCCASISTARRWSRPRRCCPRSAHRPCPARSHCSSRTGASASSTSSARTCASAAVRWSG